METVSESERKTKESICSELDSDDRKVVTLINLSHDSHTITVLPSMNVTWDSEATSMNPIYWPVSITGVEVEVSQRTEGMRE